MAGSLVLCFDINCDSGFEVDSKMIFEYRDLRDRACFVLPAKAVQENQYGKGLWTKIPADGHTTLTKPYLAGQSEDGKISGRMRKRPSATVN